MDGTLLRSDATLSRYARDGLNALTDAGVPLTIASARSAAAMRSLLDGLRLNLPVIELNGAFITDLATGEHLDHRTLIPGAVRTALNTLRELGIEPVLTSWDGSEDHVVHGTSPNHGTTWYIDEKRAYGDPRLRRSADIEASAATEKVANIVSFVPEPQAAALVETLTALLGDLAKVSSTANLYVPGWHEVEIAHPQAEKGHAIQRLCSLSKLDGAQLTVCGDHLNDLPMFALAHRRVAPSNAHPDVRSAATHITAANDEDGVVRYLLQDAGLNSWGGMCSS
ncbi:HAD-IIB family hydrolase [Streptomyces sp. SID14478]|uniref:HAD-IIB family hydrolase n=1 Tax=Streptomyces sp. SID14478 TaxID=2706073 RepID=UPI0013DD0DA6|nr:HAD-IIB family hydrolase [Streptomyces sp. SID14478]NEB74292.1 HAD-IIB family hydrolase [Streptomyces sp. SID14478]